MTGYTKLFGCIVASTIWREPHETRIVWITMLAMSDRDGIVNASLPGLADMARVTIKECKTALEALMAPDEFSRTPDHEGRRVEAVDGGWKVLNHAKYRDKMNADERREYNKRKQQEFRAKQKSTPSQTSSITVNDKRVSSAPSAHTEADSDSEAGMERAPETIPASPESSETVFNRFFALYPSKVKRQRALAAFQRNGCLPISDAVMAGLKRWIKSEQWSEPRYIPQPEKWLDDHQWEDEPLPKTNGFKGNTGPAPAPIEEPEGFSEWMRGAYGESAKPWSEIKSHLRSEMLREFQQAKL